MEKTSIKKLIQQNGIRLSSAFKKQEDGSYSHQFLRPLTLGDYVARITMTGWRKVDHPEKFVKIDKFFDFTKVFVSLDRKVIFVIEYYIGTKKAGDLFRGTFKMNPLVG